MARSPTQTSSSPPSFYRRPWSTREASMINLVVAYLLLIHVLHSIKFFLNHSVFYHLGQENCMADDASSLFYLSDTKFLTHVSVVYPQSHGSWKISPLLLELISCLISTLHRKPCNLSLLRI